MQPHAYLLPPKQRTIARFMNLGASIEWTKKILATFDQLTSKEQLHFQWLRAYADFIDEIAQVFGVTQELIQTLKINGLSEESVERCLQILLNNPTIGREPLWEQIKVYLLEERAKLPHQASVWHVCSNVIESLFGKFKERLSTNPLHGVTGLVLSLCLHTHQGVDFDIAKALEQVSIADLTQWKSTNLIDNQVVKRKKILS